MQPSAEEEAVGMGEVINNATDLPQGWQRGKGGARATRATRIDSDNYVGVAKGGDNLLRLPPLHLPHVPPLLLLLLPLCLRIKSECRTWRRRCRRVGATHRAARQQPPIIAADRRHFCNCRNFVSPATSHLATSVSPPRLPCRQQLALHLIKLQPSAASRMCRMRFFVTWKSPHHNRIMRQVAAKRITMPKRKHY